MSSQHEPMKVFLRIQGGLGNQMFQLSLGMVTNLRFNSEIHYFQQNPPLLTRIRPTIRPVEIWNFPNLSGLKIKKIQPVFKEPSSKDLYRYLEAPNNSVKISDMNYVFEELALSSKSSSFILDGYWQDLIYTDEETRHILQFFKFSEELRKRLAVPLAELSLPNAVAIHVRRGDYISNSKNFFKHGVCSLSYYLSAIELIKSNIESPKLYFFTDDIEWVSENLYQKGDEVVSKNRFSSFEELFLLCCPRNIVTSNSSFSWWGAKLDETPERGNKFVVAPYPWFKHIPKSPRYDRFWNKLHIESGETVTEFEV